MATSVDARFTAYYTANPITDTTVETDFNDTVTPVFEDITASDNNTAYEQMLAVSNYSQALTLSTDDTITTQWGITWAMTFQTSAWTAKNADDGNGNDALADAATVDTVMQATDVNWPATITADSPADEAAVIALGTAFTYTDTPDDASTQGSVAIENANTWQLIFECSGVRPVTALSTGLNELAAGDLDYNAGAKVFTATDDLTALYETGDATADVTFAVVQGAASLAAAATEVAVSLALF